MNKDKYLNLYRLNWLEANTKSLILSQKKWILKKQTIFDYDTKTLN